MGSCLLGYFAYLWLADKLGKRVAERERLLEATASLALWRLSIAALCATVVLDLLGALLARRFPLLGCRGAAPSRPGPGKVVLLRLKLGRELGVLIFGRNLALLLLPSRRLLFVTVGVHLVRVGRRLRLYGLVGCIVGARTGEAVESLLDQGLDGVLGRKHQRLSRGKSRSAEPTFWALRSLPPSCDSKPARIFFRVTVVRSAVFRMPSMMEV
jgi:hypothetical protein